LNSRQGGLPIKRSYSCHSMNAIDLRIQGLLSHMVASTAVHTRISDKGLSLISCVKSAMT
jgi:hypothetical protein